MRSLTQLSSDTSQIPVPTSGTLSATCIDVESGSTFVAWERTEEEGGGMVEVGIVRVREDEEKSELLCTFTTPSSSETPPAGLSKPHELVSLFYIPSDASLCAITRSGDIALIAVSDDLPPVADIVGTVEPGVLAASWSPDEELLALVSAADKVLLMTSSFDVLSESPLRSSEFGQDEPINVGWGSKSTQFHGSLGKAAAAAGTSSQVHSVASPYDDRLPRITWRPDSAYFSISTLDALSPSTSGRILRVYSRTAALQSTSAPLPGLEHPLAWRTSGGAPLIAAVQRYGYEGGGEGKQRSEVVFFERNGLRHGEFEVRGAGARGRVREMRWAVGGEVLALVGEGEEGDGDFVQLYTMGNWHWYLKAEMRVDGEGVTSIAWHPEKTLHLSVTTRDTLTTHTFTWDTHAAPSLTASAPSSGLVAVIDGPRTLLTPFAHANVPPPMSLTSLPHTATPTHIACHPALPRLAVLFPDNTLEIYDTSAPRAAPALVRRVEVAVQGGRQVAWAGAKDGEGEWVGVLGKEGGVELVGLEGKGGVVVVEEARRGETRLVGGKANELILHSSDGSLFCISVSTPTPTYTALPARLPSFAPHILFHPLPRTLLAFTRSSWLLSLPLSLSPTPTPHSPTPPATLLTDATSFAPTPDYLIASTSSHEAVFIPLSSLSAQQEKEIEGGKARWERRRVERGSRIVTVCPEQMGLVLQMPRGNLETIAPRPLVLEVVRGDIDRGDYRAAFIACRKHRIDMNVLYDHAPEKFMHRLESFVDQIDDVDHLNLFLTSLRNEDVTRTLYPSPSAPATADPTPTPTPDRGKVNAICDALRASLERRDLLRYAYTILTSHVRKTPADVQAGLRVLHTLKEHDADLAEDAVKYIIFLVDADTLYHVALGMYDFALVLMIAQHSQKDPREYLPFLRELQALPKFYQRFKIDDHLKRYASALGNLYAAGEEHLDEALAYTRQHGLYMHALSLSESDEAAHHIFLDAYGDHLMSQRSYRDAALSYVLAQRPDKAMEAYDRAHAWRELFALAKAEGMAEEETEELARKVADDLNQRRRFAEAGQVLLDYAKDVEQAVGQLMKGVEFPEACRICTLRNRPDLIDTLIKPGALSAQENMLEEIVEMREQLEKQVARLEQLRKLKEQQPAAFYLEDDPALENVDVSSEATTAATAFTRYTQQASTFASTNRTTASKMSAKSKRKAALKKAAGKKGTVNEEEYLLSSMDRLSERLNGTLLETQRLLPYLVLFHPSEAAELQHVLSALEGAMTAALEKGWEKPPPEKEEEPLALPGFVKERPQLPPKPVFGKTEWKVAMLEGRS